MTEPAPSSVSPKPQNCSGASPPRIEELLRAGTIPGVKFGRSWVIPRDALIRRVNELAIEQAAKRRAPIPVDYTPALRKGRRRPLPVIPD